MTWTPLVASSDFDGIQADLITVAGGIVGCLLIVLAVGILIKVFR